MDILKTMGLVFFWIFFLAYYLFMIMNANDAKDKTVWLKKNYIKKRLMIFLLLIPFYTCVVWFYDLGKGLVDKIEGENPEEDKKMGRDTKQIMSRLIRVIFFILGIIVYQVYFKK